MKKKYTYIILTTLLLIGSLIQAIQPVLAIGTNNDQKSTISKLVSPLGKLGLTTDNNSEKNNDETNNETDNNIKVNDDSSTSNVSKETPDDVNKTKESTNTNDDSKNETKKSTQSVLVKKGDIIPNLFGNGYPDFSKMLKGQPNVKAVNPVNTDEEIAYPDNAFPVFIPGVSTQKIVGLDSLSNNFVSPSDLDGSEDSNYIQYGKVMSYVDKDNKFHWVDIKESFIKLDKQGWYTASTIPPLVGERTFETGLGEEDGGHSSTVDSGLFGISGTFIEQAFMPQLLNSRVQDPPKDANGKDSKFVFNQPVTIKLSFTDHDTGKPIKVSGFLTSADIDHRDYIEYTKDSGIKDIIISDDSRLKGDTQNSDYDRVINNVGNKDYIDTSHPDDNSATLTGGYTEDLSGTYSGGSFEDDIIQPDNTRDWVSVVYENTDHLEYNINEPQEFDFLPTAILPVAFSAPIKEGDGDTYNTKWDDKDISYTLSSMLPYRGGTIHDPQTPDNDSSTISTFKQVKEFKLTDKIDPNLDVNTAKVTDTAGNDVSANFDISTNNHEVIASAKDSFLAEESNYAKMYVLKMDTSLKDGADLSGYKQEDANGQTYAKIPNVGALTVIKKEGAAEESFNSNEAYGHVKAPKIKNVDTAPTLHQSIKKDDASSDWSDGPITAKHGDKIDYKFTATNKDSANKLLSVAMQNITDNSASMTYQTDSLKIDGASVSGNSFDGKGGIDLDHSVGPNKTTTLEYTMKINDDFSGDSITNDGSMTASNYVDDSGESIEVKANQTIVNIAKDQLVIAQDVKNGSNDFATEQDVKKGDVVTYRFKIDTSKLEKDLTNVKITDIKNVYTDDTSNPLSATTYEKGSLKLVKGDSTSESLDDSNFANETITIPDTLKNSDKFVDVVYKAKVTSNKAGTIKNDGKLDATNISDVIQNPVFNTTKLNQTESNTYTVDQHVKNDSTDPAEDWKTETSASKDDVIEYKYDIKLDKDAKKSVSKASITGITNHSVSTEMVPVSTTVEVTVNKADGSVKKYNVNAGTSAGVIVSINLLSATNGVTSLDPGDSITATYKEKVVSGPTTNKIANDATPDISGYNQVNDDGEAVDPMKFPTTYLNVVENNGSITINYYDLSQKGSDGKPALITGAPNTNGTGSITINGKKGDKVSDVAKKAGIDNWLTPEYIDNYTVIQENIDEGNLTSAQKDDALIDKGSHTYNYYYQPMTLSVVAPTDWEFGKFEAENVERTYYLPAETKNNKKQPYSVKVNDFYNTEGWSLGVEQEGQFKSKAKTRTNETDEEWKQIVNDQLDKDHELTNAELDADYLNASLDEEGDDTSDQKGDSSLNVIENGKMKLPLQSNGIATESGLMTFNKDSKLHFGTADNIKKDSVKTKYNNPGYRIASLNFGNEKTADYSIGLKVPKATNRYKTDYTTNLKWTLQTGVGV